MRNLINKNILNYIEIYKIKNIYFNIFNFKLKI